MSEFSHVRRGAAAILLAMSIASPAAAGGKSLACYQQVHQPAVYKTIHEQVVVRPGGVVHETVPARYGQVTEKVLVEPERVVARHVPRRDQDRTPDSYGSAQVCRLGVAPRAWQEDAVQGGASGTVCHASAYGGGPAGSNRASADPGTLRAPYPHRCYRTRTHDCPARATGGQDSGPDGRSPACIRRLGSGLGQTPLPLNLPAAALSEQMTQQDHGNERRHGQDPGFQ
jgi:hypothetical protein